METLESSRVCRLCGQQSGISINIFDESENHVRKINAVLPIMVHELDLLPKQMCHRCSYKLEEFHKFYVDCLKTDAALKSQLSWMRKGRGREKIGVPMVHIENVKIKTEALDYDVYELEPLIENMEYINSMALPAGGIHNGLTYATLSRCYCDKKDQSRAKRTTAEFCQNYKESVSRCGEIAGDSRKKTLENTSANRLRPIKKKNTFTQAVFPDCPQNNFPCIDAVENARYRLTADTNAKDDVSSLDTRNHSYDGLEAIPKNQAASRNNIVRNLRPRKNLVNYALNKRRTIMQDLRPKENLMNYALKKKRTSIDADPGPSATSNSNISDPKMTNFELASNFKLTRQIKVEQMDELEGHNLRPRRNVVDYQEPKMRKVSDYRMKKRKVEDAEQNSKLHSKNENASSNEFALKLKIKQEILDDLEDTVLSETVSAIPRLPNNSLVDLPTKVEALTSDNDISLQDDMPDYLKSNHPQLRNKFQLAKRKSLSNIVKNRLAKTKKIYRLPTANYSPKCLRSQDLFLRNGKTMPRKNDYMEWSVKKLQKKKLMDIVNKSAKMKPTDTMKLTETIKHYCETCNISFSNKELFKLHRCYYD